MTSINIVNFVDKTYPDKYPNISPQGNVNKYRLSADLFIL